MTPISDEQNCMPVIVLHVKVMLLPLRSKPFSRRVTIQEMNTHYLQAN